jgi:hypothetical protein
MAGAAISAGFNIITGLAGAVGLGEFADSFVAKPPSAVTAVTVAVGQTTTSSDSLDGNIPSINIYALDGRRVGSASGSGKNTWAAGSSNSVSVKNNKDTQNVQSEYISLYGGGSNAICISAVGLKNPNSDQSFGWFGDVGVTCGMQWHWSETNVGTTSNTQKYLPNCVWLTQFVEPGDKPSNGINTCGFSMHIVDFSQVTEALSTEYAGDVNMMCGGPARFSAYSTIIDTIDPVFFLPALTYKADGSDSDISAVLAGGTDLTDYTRIQVNTRGEAIHPIRIPFSAPAPPPAATTTAPPAVPTIPPPPPPPSTVDGAGNFGGLLGSIPNPDAAATTAAPAVPTVPTATVDGAGSFGGVVGSIPNPDAEPEKRHTGSASRISGNSRNNTKSDNSKIAKGYKAGKAIDHMGSNNTTSGTDNTFLGSIIHSAHPGHSAKQLCESATSYGPDAISEVEQLFCDMSTKTLYPLCSPQVTKGCFDTDVVSLRISLSKRFEGANPKNYHRVQKWGFDA